MSLHGDISRPPVPRRWTTGRLAIFASLVLAAAFILIVTQIWPAIVLLVIHSLAGWAFHLGRLFQTVTWNWLATLLAVAALAAGFTAARSFANWTSNRAGLRLPGIRATLVMLAIFLCGAAAAIAVSGIVHEMAWLLRKPVVILPGRSGALIEKYIRMQKLQSALSRYTSIHGRYPHRLEELAGGPEIAPADLFCRPSDDTVLPEPFIYLKPGDEPDRVAPETIILLAPGNRSGQVFAGRADGSSTSSLRAVPAQENLRLWWPDHGS